MPDHSVKYVNMVCHRTRDQNGQLECIAAVQDVTRRRLSEEALGKARSELARVARVTSLGALTASIAREVNQPLSAIITNAVRLAVQDAGVGLDPQSVDRLFEAFYTTKSGGMGIGLPVSRSILESHHGRIWAASNDGPGPTFSFSIPPGSEGATGADSNRDIRTLAVTDAA
jgi:signal transduction histidine kinase